VKRAIALMLSILLIIPNVLYVSAETAESTRVDLSWLVQETTYFGRLFLDREHDGVFKFTSVEELADFYESNMEYISMSRRFDGQGNRPLKPIETEIFLNPRFDESFFEDNFLVFALIAMHNIGRVEVLSLYSLYENWDVINIEMSLDIGMMTASDERTIVFEMPVSVADREFQTTLLLYGTEVIAEPTAAPIFVNGELAAFQAYHIRGWNFFKLRDIAYVLNGTSAEFNVEWDGARSAILLNTSQAYESVGGEMVNTSTGNTTAILSQTRVFVDGDWVHFMAPVYYINGNHYFMLRNLGRALNFNVDWDAETGSILINTDY